MKIPLFCFLAGLSLSACEQPSSEWSIERQDGAHASVAMQAPSFITQLRMVNPDELVLDVTANNLSVPMVRNDSGQWQGQLNFDPDQSVTVVAAWSASRATLLPLASARRTITVPDNPAGISVTVAENRFTTNFDSDADRLSNIAELRAGSDPLNGASPAMTPEQMPVRINFGVPSALQNADEATINALSLSVLVNDRVYSVTRNGNVWSGNSSEVQGNDVFIDAKFYSNSTRTELLDRYELRHMMDSNGVFLGLDTEAPTP